MPKQTNFFTKHLMEWTAANPRPLPWKATQNAYHIWLSEIILQQTRVEQGTPYYHKFINAYPSITDLANAPADEVMRLWEGLGYYSRARNLHAAAKYVADELNGIFPSTHEEIKKLKGVGPYTAAAIASFAYNLPYSVVDGNVYRVLSRFFGIETPIDTTIGKKEFAQLAQEALHKKDPATYNQAIMNFGALQCKPANPLCEVCPLQKKCVAFKTDKIGLLPIKSKKIKRTERFFNYLLIQPLKKENQVFISKRLAKDIWQNLYEFPLIETKELLTQQELLAHPSFNLLINNTSKIKQVQSSKSYKQQLTHQKINAQFFVITLPQKYISASATKQWQLITKKEMDNYAFPRIVNSFLENQHTSGNKQLLLNL